MFAIIAWALMGVLLIYVKAAKCYQPSWVLTFQLYLFSFALILITVEQKGLI